MEQERRADNIAQLKRQQPVVPVEARRASGRGARQQPAFNLSSSYLNHVTRCGIVFWLCALVALLICHHRGISTVLLQPLNVHPVSQKEYPQSEWSMTIQTLSFKLGHVSARERLHACLCFKLVHVSENVQQCPIRSHCSVASLPIKTYSQCLMTLIYL